MANETLLAIPFFTFMGLMLERSGMAEDLLETVGQLFGTARGGLAYAVIFVGALLAATTGVVAASVIAMGLISLPIMLRYGYDRRLASGVIAASGTLAQIIPPSLVLIVLADQLGRSVGAMYAGAFLPGLLLALLYAGYVFIVSHLAPGGPGSAGRGDRLSGREWRAGSARSRCSPRPRRWRAGGSCAGALCRRRSRDPQPRRGNCGGLRGRRHRLARRARVGTAAAVAAGAAGDVRHGAAAAAIFLVLGTIFIGLATPTEGGAMGALGALLLAFARRLVDGNPKRFNLALVRSAAEATARLSAFVLFILIGARIFSLTFYGINGHLWVERLFTALPGGETGSSSSSTCSCSCWPSSSISSSSPSSSCR